MRTLVVLIFLFQPFGPTKDACAFGNVSISFSALLQHCDLVADLTFLILSGKGPTLLASV